MDTPIFQANSKPNDKKVAPGAPSEGVSPAATKRQRDGEKETEKDEIEGGAEVSNKRGKTDEPENPQSPEVQELLSFLEPGKGREEGTWLSELGECFKTPSFQQLASFVSQKRESDIIFPPVEDTFSALNFTPLDQVKVVVIGKHPYHGEGQAHGLCFSVRKGTRITNSLRNIYEELLDDPDVPDFNVMPTHGYLERWAQQGVLMINAILTARSAKPYSHKNKGWELVIDEIIRAVDRRSKATGRGVVFLLLGKAGTRKATTAFIESSKRHRIIYSPDPSPTRPTKSTAILAGSRCFSETNEALRQLGYEGQIDWRVDGPLPVRYMSPARVNNKDEN